VLTLSADHAFDHHTDYFDWLQQVCEKHRASCREKLQRRRG